MKSLGENLQPQLSHPPAARCTLSLPVPSRPDQSVLELQDADCAFLPVLNPARVPRCPFLSVFQVVCLPRPSRPRRAPRSPPRTTSRRRQHAPRRPTPRSGTRRVRSPQAVLGEQPPPVLSLPRTTRSRRIPAQSQPRPSGKSLIKSAPALAALRISTSRTVPRSSTPNPQNASSGSQSSCSDTPASPAPAPCSCPSPSRPHRPVALAITCP